MKRSRDTVRTGELARVFGIAPRTVAKWIDAGTLPGFRIPPTSERGAGSRPRVVTMSDAIAFARRNGLPMDRIPPEWYAGGAYVVAVAVPEWTEARPESCHEAFADYVDYLMSGKSAAVLVIGTSASRSQAARVMSHTVVKSPRVKIVVVAAEDGPGELSAAVAKNVHVVRYRPFDVKDVELDVAECLGRGL